MRVVGFVGYKVRGYSYVTRLPDFDEAVRAGEIARRAQDEQAIRLADVSLGDAHAVLRPGGGLRMAGSKPQCSVCREDQWHRGRRDASAYG